MKYVFCGLMALSFIFSPTLSKAASIHGVLMVVKGKVIIVSGKNNRKSRARVGKKVFPGDTVITEKDSRAKIVMVDKNVLQVSPNSKVEIANYEFKPEENKKNVILNVIYGKVRSKVNQKYNGEQNKFRVKTPSAVAGVRGTDFFMSFSELTESSKVVTFEGQVEVGSEIDTGGNIANSVFVNPGQFTVSTKNAPPALPIKLSAREMKQHNQETQSDESSDESTRTPAADPRERGKGKKKGLFKDDGSQESDNSSDESSSSEDNVGTTGESSGDANSQDTSGDTAQNNEPTAGETDPTLEPKDPKLNEPDGSKDVASETEPMLEPEPALPPPPPPDGSDALLTGGGSDDMCPTCGLLIDSPIVTDPMLISDDIIRSNTTRLIIEVNTQ